MGEKEEILKLKKQLAGAKGANATLSKVYEAQKRTIDNQKLAIQKYQDRIKELEQKLLDCECECQKPQPWWKRMFN